MVENAGYDKTRGGMIVGVNSREDDLVVKVENDEEVALEGFQNLVDGYVEVYPMKHEHLLFLVDEEGLIKQKEFNDLYD